MKYFDEKKKKREKEIAELKAQKELYKFAVQQELFHDEGRTYCEVKRGIYSNFTNRMKELINFEVREQSDLAKLEKLITKCQKLGL